MAVIDILQLYFCGLIPFFIILVVIPRLLLVLGAFILRILTVSLLKGSNDYTFAKTVVGRKRGLSRYSYYCDDRGNLYCLFLWGWFFLNCKIFSLSKMP